MSGNGYQANGNYPSTTTPPQTTTPTYPNGGASWGCIGGVWGWNNAATGTSGTPITIDVAVQTANNYVASLNNPDLAVDEVEEYTQNFYVLVKEKSTGNGAFELLIDKYTGSIGPEMGPNIMWNTKYGTTSGVTGGIMGLIRNGIMGGMMGGYGYGYSTGPMTVTVDQAKANAQQFLDAYYPGTTVGDVDTFYGYYHIDVLNAGTTFGMLSINGYTGQVWYHTWHGAYIQTVEL